MREYHLVETPVGWTCTYSDGGFVIAISAVFDTASEALNSVKSDD